MGAALPREGVPLKYPTRATTFDGEKGGGSFGSTIDKISNANQTLMELNLKHAHTHAQL